MRGDEAGGAGVARASSKHDVAQWQVVRHTSIKS